MDDEETQIEALVVSLCGDTGSRRIMSCERVQNVITGIFSDRSSTHTFRMLVAIKDEDVFVIMATVDDGTYLHDGIGWRRL